MNEPENKAQEKDPFDIDIQACSTMDCTGLIPSAPVNEDALTSYETVYHYLPPQIKNAQKKTED